MGAIRRGESDFQGIASDRVRLSRESSAYRQIPGFFLTRRSVSNQELLPLSNGPRSRNLPFRRVSMKGVYSVGISGLSGNCFHSRPKIPVGHQPITDFVGDSGSSKSKVTVGIASASDDRKVRTGLPSEGSPI